MTNANIENFIASSNDDYIKKAFFYSNNINELDKARKHLFDKINDTPLFDTNRFSIDFCEALEKMQKIKSKNDN